MITLKENEITRAFNDTFREGLGRGMAGRVMLTRGVMDLGYERGAFLLDSVRRFKEFTSDNDPYAEHDFGSITIDDDKFFFKIDYYNADYTMGIHPNDPDCHRVLTIMRADEY